MARIGIVYSSTDGHTLQICQRIEQQLLAAGHRVELIAAAAGTAIKGSDYDQVVIGARIRFGHHHAHILRLVQDHRSLLQSLPNAFFSVNLVARKAGKDTPQGNPYVRKFLRQTGWKPGESAVFAGKLDYAKYSFFDRHVIRFIMWLTGGPVNLDACVDYTDWNAVDQFAARISRQA